MRSELQLSKRAHTSVSLLPTGSIESYLRKIQEIPLLSAEEEQALALQYKNQGDLGAAHTLTLAHLRYVARIAKNYNGYGLALADLMQEGTIGLMKAIKRFDPAMGVRLVSFAVHWIKAEIHEFVIRNWRIVRIATTKAQRKLFFNLRKQKQRLGWFGAEEIEAVAHDLGVKPAEVQEMELRLNAYEDVSFELDPEETTTFAPALHLEAPAEMEPLVALQTADDGKVMHLIQKALNSLDNRSQIIVQERWLRGDHKTTFQELAARFKISIERVRQLEVAALKKIKAVFTADPLVAEDHR